MRPILNPVERNEDLTWISFGLKTPWSICQSGNLRCREADFLQVGQITETVEPVPPPAL